MLGELRQLVHQPDRGGHLLLGGLVDEALGQRSRPAGQRAVEVQQLTGLLAGARGLPDDLAATLATEGSFRNSGQRCTAVKRILVEEPVLDEFTDRFVANAAEFTVGDPADEATRIGTVIDEPAAIVLEERVAKAVAAGAEVLLGGNRNGAQLEPTIIANVPRDAEMVREESFGPLAPIMPVRDLDDAIALANASDFGLSSGVVTNDMAAAIRVVKELKTGAVNVNQVPGFRMESSPFGGVKDSGLGIKEGVIQAMKFMSTTKTFSLPW